MKAKYIQKIEIITVISISILILYELITLPISGIIDTIYNHILSKIGPVS